jgi:hypothetical protein
VKETRIEKRGRSPLKERGQYTLGFSVIALMLYVAGFPIFLLFFLGVLAFFIWKVFSTESRSDTRRILSFISLLTRCCDRMTADGSGMKYRKL